MMAAALLATMAVTAQTHNIVVDAKKAGAPIQPTMYGLFFEDINYAADGGLYGELVKNRSFEFPQHFMGWQTFGSVELKNDGPFERCPHYVTLRDPGHAHRRSGLINEGYFGIGLKQGEEYRFSVWAKSPHAKGEIRVQFIDAYTSAEDQKFANEHIKVTSADWQKYEVVLRSDRTINRAQLRIFLTGSEEVSLEHISLFPVNTFKGRRNGLRADIAQALAAASWRGPIWHRATSGKIPSVRSKTVRLTKTAGNLLSRAVSIPIISKATASVSSNSSNLPKI